MTLFIDRFKREIEIVVDGYDAEATHYGRKIGDVTTSGPREIDIRVQNEPAEITGMFVDGDYQRAGIGLELIRQLAEEIGTLAPAKENMGQGDKNALTDDGLRLTKRAQVCGYVYPFEDERIDHDDEDEWIEDDE
jgi:GNAT superfamily N-acetyltransferase